MHRVLTFDPRRPPRAPEPPAPRSRNERRLERRQRRRERPPHRTPDRTPRTPDRAPDRAPTRAGPRRTPDRTPRRAPTRAGRRRRRAPARTTLLIAAAVSAGTLTTLSFEPDAPAQARRKIAREDLALKGSVAARPLVLIGLIGLLALLPFVIIMVTSFVKISVVLSIVRSAIGTQQIPPTQVITGMAIILTVYIMAPVGLEIYRATESLVQERRPGQPLASAESAELLFRALQKAKGPIQNFLAKNSHLKDRAMFFGMAKRLRKPEDRSGVGPDDLMVLVPSFVISELKEAFQIGFIIFVPFLVIDMVVSNILMALGMQMLSPTTISLPFKLLLFVTIDGWYLLTKGLITGYV